MNIEPLKHLHGAVVAIDGPAGVGKSTIARTISDHLGYHFVNSGNFYRAITYTALHRNIDLTAEDQIIAVARSVRLSLKDDLLTVDGEIVEGIPSH